MAITRWQLALRSAQAPVAMALKPLGFRKAGNFFNRVVDDGLVQVVGFQSGPATSVLHGNFTVNLGVFVPCLAALEHKGGAARRTLTDAHCEVRSRLSKAAGLGSDRWWPLDQTAEETGIYVAGLLVEFGVPFLDRYASHRQIIARFDEEGVLPFHNPARSALAVAVICACSGDLTAAADHFEQAKALAPSHEGFRRHVESLRAACQLQGTGPRV